MARSDALTTPAPETQTIPAARESDTPTWPPMSSNRFEGMAWAERLLSQARPASGDAARFAAGL